MLIPRNAMIAPAAMVSRTREPPPPARMAKAITPTPSGRHAHADVRDVRREHAAAAARSPRAARRSAARAWPSRRCDGRNERGAEADAERQKDAPDEGIEIAAVGRSTPTALNSAFRPIASRMPKTMPISEAASPISAASSSTERITCRRLAPERAQHRELAHPLGDGDRVRVEDDEQADEHRGAGEGEQDVGEEAGRALDVARLLVGVLWPVCTLTSPGTTASRSS